MAALIAVELYVGAWVVFCWDPQSRPFWAEPFWRR